MFRLVIDRIKNPIVLLLIVLSLAACDEIVPPIIEELEETETEVPTSSVETELLSLVNDLRAEGCTCGDKFYNSVGNLEKSDLLEEAALRHSNDMANNNHFAHVGTDGSTFTDRISETGYKFFSAGENIAFGYSSASGVLEGWKNSVGHCRILMDSKASEMGVASVKGYWTMVLAKPSGN